MLDATGTDIVLFTQNYGYAANRNGMNVVIYGKVVKINKSSVTVAPSTRLSGYGNQLNEERGPFNKISIKAEMLFPTNIGAERLESNNLLRLARTQIQLLELLEKAFTAGEENERLADPSGKLVNPDGFASFIAGLYSTIKNATDG